MIKFILKKMIMLIVMLVMLSIIVFYIAHLSPGDPLQSFYGDQMQSMSAHEIDLARTRLGLDLPIWRQYFQWSHHLLQGDLGMSLKYKRPVVGVVLPLMKNTLILGCTAYILIFILAVVLAFICVRYEESWLDRLLCKVGTIAYYLPAFWVGVVLVLIFSINLRWLPSSGAYSFGQESNVVDRMKHLILPLIVMITSHLWYFAYMFRNRLLDETAKDYVLLARAKGLSPVQILFYHCLRNALPTIVSMMAISISHILSGTYIVEAVFNYQGLGLISVSSAKYHDYNLLMILMLLTGLFVIGGGVVAQIVNEFIDPRIKSDEIIEL